MWERAESKSYTNPGFVPRGRRLERAVVFWRLSDRRELEQCSMARCACGKAKVVLASAGCRVTGADRRKTGQDRLQSAHMLSSEFWICWMLV